jgi:hypothetical protein
VNSYVEQREGGVDIHEVNYKQEKVFGKRAKRRHIQVYVDEAKKQSAKLKSKHAFGSNRPTGAR